MKRISLLYLAAFFSFKVIANELSDSTNNEDDDDEDDDYEVSGVKASESSEADSGEE